MDYAPIQAFLVGRCGKTIVQAALTSYEEFVLLADGKAAEEHAEWERLRWRVFMDWKINPNLKRRPNTVHDVVRFPWEEIKSAEAEHYEPLTDEELKGLCEIFKIKREDIK
jgi:hypothetical protein